MEPDPVSVPADPVLAFAALGHPQRLAVVRLLMRHYPRRVAAGEVGAALGLKASTLSGYFAQLMEAGLVTQERRGTSLLYAASVEGATALNDAWIGAISGGRGWPQAAAPGPRVRNVLFLGCGNAGPSLIAEALLRTRAGEGCEVFSAGIEAPGAPDDGLMAFLGERGHETGLLWAKPQALWLEDGAPRMDIVITLGDRAASRAPDWPGGPHRGTWRLNAGLEWEGLYADLDARLTPLAGLDLAVTTPARVQAAVDAMAEPLG